MKLVLTRKPSESSVTSTFYPNTTSRALRVLDTMLTRRRRYHVVSDSDSEDDSNTSIEPSPTPDATNSESSSEQASVAEDEESESEPSDDELISNIQTTTSLLDSQIRNLEAKKNIALKDKTPLRQTCDMLRDDVEQINERLTHKNETIEDMTIEADRQTNRFKREERTLRLRVKGQDVLLSEKEDKLKKMAGQGTNQEEILAHTALQEEFRLSQQHSDQCATERQEQSDRIEALAHQLTEESPTITTQTTTLLEKDTRISALETRIQDLNSQLHHQKEKLDTKDAEIQDLSIKAREKHAETEMLWDRVAYLQAESKKRVREGWKFHP